MVTHRKKLIEVALPLEAINVASAREKSIRHGHPSTLHLWWARRPLAACRAVLFASLVDDPDSDPAFRKADGSVDEERASARRAELFNLIEELVQWENSNNERVINAARAEIAACIASRKVHDTREWKKDQVVVEGTEARRHGGTKGAGSAGLNTSGTAWSFICRMASPEDVNTFLAAHAPPVLDPFCGGGSIPLEAQRLGLRAYGSDLNPVPVLITKALIEIPPKFANRPPVNPDSLEQGKLHPMWRGAQGLAEDVRYYGKWMRDQAHKRIGHLYPPVKITAAMAQDRPDLKPYVGEELTVIAWLWARTVASPNPAVGGAHVPLVRSYWLSTKKGKEAWVEPVIDRESNSYRFEVRLGTPSAAQEAVIDAGTKIGRGCKFKCLLSDQPIGDDHVKQAGTRGELGARLLAIVAEGTRGRVYLSPLPEHERLAASTARPADVSAIEAPLANDPRNLWCLAYGLDRFDKLFTSRQLVALTTFSDLVAEARAKVLADAQALWDKRESAGGGEASASDSSSRPGSIPGSPAFPPAGKGKKARQNQGLAPQNEGVARRNEGVAPQNEGVALQNEGMARQNEGVARRNEGMAPQNEGMAPQNEGMAPQNEGMARRNDATGPATASSATVTATNLFAPDTLAPSPDPRHLIGPTPQEYADAVATYLAFVVARTTDRTSTICSWDSSPKMEALRNTFARQALPMTWDFAEGNPWSASSGNWNNNVEWVAKVVDKPSDVAAGMVWQLDATSCLASVDQPVLSTDPPYYDNIGYADLSDFFYIWLRRSLCRVYPQLFATLLTPKAQELIASPYRHEGGKEAAQSFFEEGLGKVFARMRAAEHPDYPLTVYYAFKQAEEDDDEDGNAGVSPGKSGRDGRAPRAIASTGWETMLEGLIRSGFAITGTWPMRTELGNRMVGMGTNALASSIVLVCRPRLAEAALATRREFLNALKRELPSALRNLQRGSVAPVDLAQAAIGPGMAIFSRYARVMESSGQPMTVRSALAAINQVLDEVLSEQEGEFDADTRWALAWFEQFAMEEGKYGDAETLSTAKNTSVSGLVESGILHARGGKVRLLRRDELGPDWDPATDRRLTTWEVTQHLIRALETGGEQSAANLLKKVGGLGEVARDLAYRLYSICERKKWAQEALAYNSLVIAWPEITKLAQGRTPPPAGPGKQGELYP